jgi:(2Fe-2S) ferredoxin
VELGWQSCFGRCSQGPNVQVCAIVPSAQQFTVAIMPPRPGQNAALYNGVAPTDVARILEEHVLGGKVLREMILLPSVSDPKGGTSR